MSRKVNSYLYVPCKRSGAFWIVNSTLCASQDKGWMQFAVAWHCSQNIFDRNYCKLVEMIWYTDWLAKQRERRFREIFLRVENGWKFKEMPESCTRRNMDSTCHNLLQHCKHNITWRTVRLHIQRIFGEFRRYWRFWYMLMLFVICGLGWLFEVLCVCRC